MKLFLCGGGCGEQTAAANRVFNAYIDHDKPLLYIPLAMGERDHTYDECYEWIQGELAEVKVPSIDMVRSYEELVAKNLSDYGSIFIGGGNTFELLKGMKDSGAFAKMEEYIRNDGVVMGGSAGAIIFGKDIMTAIAMDPNDVALEDTAGFNALDDCSIFPHYTNEWTPEAHVRFTEFIEKYTSEKEAVYALPEEDTIFINGDQVQVIGDRPYYFFEGGTGEKKRAELRLELSDNEWPLEYIDHDRPIARAIVFDDDGYFYFMRAHRQDDFGHATIIET
ncbi:MAG: Type 1 glutamine amidotransferase-like domain-containing protein, partial [Clostridiales bacterium]|nr:Type 1 glutamine amidotransferase-like domain-containing protein [Clostridiales bacterium]